MKLATFIEGIINFQNILKIFWKIVCCRRICRRQKRCSKTAKFFLMLLYHIQNYNHLLLNFSFYSKTHEWWLVKKLGSYLNSKCLKKLIQVLRHKLFAPTVHLQNVNCSRICFFYQLVVFIKICYLALNWKWTKKKINFYTLILPQIFE